MTIEERRQILSECHSALIALELEPEKVIDRVMFHQTKARLWIRMLDGKKYEIKIEESR